MPRYVKGDHAIETSVPSEGVELQAQGYKKEKARTKKVRQRDEQRQTDSGQKTPPAA